MVPFSNNNGFRIVTLSSHFFVVMYDNERGGIRKLKNVAECKVMMTNNNPFVMIVPSTEIKVRIYGQFGNTLGRVFIGPFFKNVTKPNPPPRMDDA